MRAARTALAAGAAALLTALAVAGPGGAVATDEVVLKVGDRVRVDGEPIGCEVRRVDGAPHLDCRRAGRLAGTYGTMLGARKARAVRFVSGSTARVVFEGRHRGSFRRCRAR